MEMSNTRIVPASPERVWAALNDPEILKASIPGCESLERVSDDEWRAVMAARIGPVSAKFSGKMHIVDSTPPSGYTLKFEGQGGAAGFASGEAKVTLTPSEPEQTALNYKVKAQIGGKLAQIGSRLVDGAAAKIADDFFTRFAEAVGPKAPVAGAPVATPTTAISGRLIRYAAVAAILILIGYLHFRGVKF